MKLVHVFVSQDQAFVKASIRPTRQRRALWDLIERNGARHMSAEQVYREATTEGLRLSLATVYNTLNLFCQQGLLHRIDLGERIWFCSNRESHYHLYDEGSGELSDVPIGGKMPWDGVPLPDGAELVRADIIVRYRRRKA